MVTTRNTTSGHKKRSASKSPKRRSRIETYTSPGTSTGAKKTKRKTAHAAPGRTSRSKTSSKKPRGTKSRRPGNKPATKTSKRETSLNIPPAGDNVRIIPLGGVEEVGKNMYVVEYGDDIVIIDAGFGFTSEETPGVDYILPNTQYLEERKEKIRGVVITHGHLDHIGGIPYIMPRIGNPPIYSRNLTTLMIKKRQSEFRHLDPLDLRIVENDSVITLGKLKVRFFGVTHTIPDSMGIIIETPYGSVINPGDFKLSHNDGEPTDEEEESYKIFDTEKVLLLMTDSTNVDNPGFSTPEHVVKENLDKIIKDTKTRLIIGAFASQFERMISIIESAEKYNKKVIMEGRSMKTNIEVAKEAGLLKVKKGTLISSDEMSNYPPDRIVILATGSQGEEFAALMRISNKTHKSVRMSDKDTILLSSSIVPGNENSVQKLKDNIARTGAKIIHYRTSEVFIHGSGHGNRGEVEWLHKKIKPKFFIPIHGSHYMLRRHAQLAEELGMPKKNIAIPDNGSIIEVTDGGEKIEILKDKAPSDIVAVDGFSIGNMQDVVIRDRQLLSEDGIFIIVIALNTRTGKLRKSPDIISRGFIYLRESQNLLQESRLLIKKTVEDSTKKMKPINFDILKTDITDQVRKFLLQKTDKRPVVIPVILGM